MHITEIPKNAQITIIASIDKNYLEFSSRVVDIKDDVLIIEAVTNNEGQHVSLVSDKIKFDISYVDEDNKPPFIWRDIKSKFIRIGNTPFHILKQTSDGKRENRRNAFRLFVGESAQLALVSKPGKIEVTLKDVSVNGYAFIYYGELDINKFCSISCMIDTTTVVLSGVIVRKQYLGNGKIMYGCKMDKFSKELEKFIAKKQRELLNQKFRG